MCNAKLGSPVNGKATEANFRRCKTPNSKLSQPFANCICRVIRWTKKTCPSALHSPPVALEHCLVLLSQRSRVLVTNQVKEKLSRLQDRIPNQPYRQFLFAHVPK